MGIWIKGTSGIQMVDIVWLWNGLAFKRDLNNFQKYEHVIYEAIMIYDATCVCSFLSLPFNQTWIER